MSKKKCDFLLEEGPIAKCNGAKCNDECPKTRIKYHVTAKCWQV